MSVTETSGVYAVIAPNMGKQIVALQVKIFISNHCSYQQRVATLGAYTDRFVL